MRKNVDLTKSVFDLIHEYPELKEIMAELGFSSVTNPTMIHTVGRVMTIPKGASMRGLDLDQIIAELERRGYTVDSDAEKGRK